MPYRDVNIIAYISDGVSVQTHPSRACLKGLTLHWLRKHTVSGRVLTPELSLRVLPFVFGSYAAAVIQYSPRRSLYPHLIWD